MWFNKSIEDVIEELDTSLNGLDEEKVEVHRKIYGENVLENVERESIIKSIFNSAKEPLTLVLIGIIMILLFIKEYKEVIIISIIIIVNIIIATIQEIKSQKALDSLKKLTLFKSTVIRHNKILEIDSNDLVVGDIIVLEAGNYIPADIRLIEVASLEIDESALTGESIPIEKSIEPINDIQIAVADRCNMLYSSTFITKGRAKGVVVAVGKNSEIGKIAALINQAKKQTTPLQNRLAQLSKYVSVFAFVVAIIILLLNLFINDVNFVEAVITAITLAVAVIPESLPVIVSIVLALSTAKMAKHNAIVKKLPAVESLGTVNIICTGKTGTLTLNKMSVTDYFIANAEINQTTLTLNDRLIQAMVLCNDSFIDSKGNAIGDPTELAAQDIGVGFLKYNPPVDLKLELGVEDQQVMVGETKLVSPESIDPTFWNTIKASEGAYTWEFVNPDDSMYLTLSNTDQESVGITGLVETPEGYYVELRLTIRDIYNNEVSDIVRVLVTPKQDPVIEEPVVNDPVAKDPATDDDLSKTGLVFNPFAILIVFIASGVTLIARNRKFNI